jgi:hypothetical protein
MAGLKRFPDLRMASPLSTICTHWEAELIDVGLFLILISIFIVFEGIQRM